MVQKWVVKVGSSSLTDDTGRLSTEKMANLVSQIAKLQLGGELSVLLVSSGAVATGVGVLSWDRARLTMPEKQAAAAVGQGILTQHYRQLFDAHGLGVAQVLLTRSDIEDRHRFVHVRNTLSTLLHHGIVPIINENDTVAVEEIRFGDNDTLAALVALVAEAERLILLTDIDGIYTADPHRDKHASRLTEVARIEDILAVAGPSHSRVGTGGMQTKLTAAQIATDAGIDVVIAKADAPNVLFDLAVGKAVGTRIHASMANYRSRASWLAHGAKSEGTIVVDTGAEFAVRQGGSLLIPGILRVDGTFKEGAIVDLCTVDARGTAAFGRGLSGMAAEDIRIWVMRRQSGEDTRHIGEVVHRNDMVVRRE